MDDGLRAEIEKQLMPWVDAMAIPFSILDNTEEAVREWVGELEARTTTLRDALRILVLAVGEEDPDAGWSQNLMSASSIARAALGSGDPERTADVREIPEDPKAED